MADNWDISQTSWNLVM